MTDLTERYVGATLRSIPDKQRTEIEAELRGSIGDAVEARVESGEDLETAERTVLTGLGDPDRLAANYTGHTGYLIGPDSYFVYRRLLIVLFVTVVPLSMVGVAIAQVLSGAGFGSVVGSSLSVAIAVTVHIGFWTTLVFALMERSGQPPIGAEWSVSQLPPTPGKATIKLGETVVSVVALTIAIAALSLSRVFSPITADDGSLIPVFDPDLWSFWIPYFIIVLGVEVVFEMVKYRVGRWTSALAWANLGLNLLFAVPAIYLLVTDGVLNPEFVSALSWPAGVIDTSGMVTAVVIALVTSWDAFDGFRKARL